MIPCPSCGQQPRVFADTPVVGYWFVRCESCYEPGAPEGHGTTRVDAVRRWAQAVAEFEMRAL